MGERTFRTLLESAPDAMVITDRTGKILLVNSQTEIVFGYPRDELIEQPAELLIPENLRAEHASRLAAFFAQPVRAEFEIQGRRKNGSTFPAEIRVSPLETDSGTLVSSAIRDITERRRVEESLRRTEERFRLLVESVKDYAIYILDTDGHVASWNLGAERIKGYQATEIIGQHFSRFYDADDIEQGKPQEALNRAATEGRHEDEGWRLRKDGSRFWANSVVTPLRSESGVLHGFAKVTRDMTRVNEAHNQALQSERLATGAAIVAGLAHESRNGLQQIQSSVEMLTRRLQDGAARNLITEIQKAHDRLLRVFEDVRAYATPLRLNRRMHNIASIWRGAWQHLDSLKCDRHASLEEKTNGLDLNCPVDEYAMEQAFHNIFLNSLFACTDPAIIQIHCSETELHHQPGVRLAICDNGPGLDPEQKEKIFQPFYTTKTKGTGLGMAITKRVVEAHGGQIDVALDCRIGTEIVITLPRGNP
jgi:PAS domain S-box-containing protein